MRIDVAIAGAGPAGSACAIALRTRMPSLSVALIEASRFDTPRIGETLSPAARPLLERLGLLEEMCAHREAHGTAASWGGEWPHENDYLFHARGPGWHLDRTRFDAMLAHRAESCEAMLLTGTAVRDAVRRDEGWELALSNGETMAARFLVDATGSASLATRYCGARIEPLDHLVSFGRFFDDRPDADPRTVVEAFEDGWWYTAALPGQARFVACMTDSAIARRLRIHEDAQWDRLLHEMPLIGSIVRGMEPRGPVVARACGSQRLDVVAGEDWLAAGDAAWRCDPLSSAGITKALRSGIFASYAIGGPAGAIGDPIGLRRYAQLVHAEFGAYLATRAKLYGEEGRWQGNEFWAGRRRVTSEGRAS